MNVEVFPQGLIKGKRYKVSNIIDGTKGFGTFLKPSMNLQMPVAHFSFDKYYSNGMFHNPPPRLIPIPLRRDMGWRFYNTRQQVVSNQTYRGLADEKNLPENTLMKIENYVKGQPSATVKNLRTYPSRANNMNNPTYYTQNRVNTSLFNGGRRTRKTRKARRT